MIEKLKRRKSLFLILSLSLLIAFTMTTAAAATEGKVYQGYFENPDYSAKELFLQEDSQTKITPIVQEVADEIDGGKSLSTLGNIYEKTQEIIPYDREKDTGVGDFTTSATELIKRGFSYGCNNYATLFVTLARAKGIPTVLVNAAELDWLGEFRKQVKNGERIDYFAGHAFAECYVDGEWHLVDPSSGELYKDYDKTNLSIPKRMGYIVYAKSLSQREQGFEDHGDFMVEAFKGKDIKYKDPGYNKVDLTSIKTKREKLMGYGVIGLILLGALAAN